MNRYNNSVYYHQNSNSAHHRGSPNNFRRSQNQSAPQNQNFRYDNTQPGHFSASANYPTFSTPNTANLGYHEGHTPLHATGYTQGHPAAIYHSLTNHPYANSLNQPLPVHIPLQQPALTTHNNLTPNPASSLDPFQQKCKCPKSGVPCCRQQASFQSIDITRHNDYVGMECTNELCDHAKITLNKFTNNNNNHSSENNKNTGESKEKLDDNINNKYYDHPILVHRACQSQLENELISILKNSSSTVGYSDKDRKARLWDNFNQWSVIPEFAQLVRCWRCQDSGRIGHLRVNLTFNYNKFIQNCEYRKNNQHLQINSPPTPSFNPYKNVNGANPGHPAFNQAGPLRFNAVYPPGHHNSQNSPKIPQRGQEKYHFQPQANSPYSQYQKQNYNYRIQGPASQDNFKSNNFQTPEKGNQSKKQNVNPASCPSKNDSSTGLLKLKESPRSHRGLVINETSKKSPDKDLGIGLSDEDNSFPLQFDPTPLPKMWSIPAISDSFNHGTLSNIPIDEPWLIQDNFDHYDNNYSIQSEIEWRQAKQRQNKINQQGLPSSNAPGNAMSNNNPPTLSDKELRTLHSIPDAVDHVSESMTNLNVNVTQFEAITHVDFPPRKNFDDFKKLLDKKQINPYNIMMEAAEGGQANSNQIGIDNLRTHILSNLSQCHCQELPCVICEEEMPIYHHFPLLSGLMYLSTETTTFKKATSKKVQLENDGEHYNLYAICLKCCQGLNRQILCNFCETPWRGSVFQLGTLYMFDVFACFPCCRNRKLCKDCETEISNPDSSFDSFSQKIQCPNCRIKRSHFVHSSDTFKLKILDPALEAKSKIADSGPISSSPIRAANPLQLKTQVSRHRSNPLENLPEECEISKKSSANQALNWLKMDPQRRNNSLGINNQLVYGPHGGIRHASSKSFNETILSNNLRNNQPLQMCNFKEILERHQRIAREKLLLAQPVETVKLERLVGEEITDLEEQNSNHPSEIPPIGTPAQTPSSTGNSEICKSNHQLEDRQQKQQERPRQRSGHQMSETPKKKSNTLNQSQEHDSAYLSFNENSKVLKSRNKRFSKN